MTTKRTKLKRKTALGIKRQVFKQPTLTHIHYHPEAGLVRAHIEQDVTVLNEVSRQGRDVDIAVGDLSSEILSALENVFRKLAAEVKAAPFKEG